MNQRYTNTKHVTHSLPRIGKIETDNATVNAPERDAAKARRCYTKSLAIERNRDTKAKEISQ